MVAPLYHTDRGGLGRQAVLLTERLAALGVGALVATRRMTGLPARAWSADVGVRPIPAGRPEVHNYERPDLRNLLTSLRFTAGACALLVRERARIDVVHVHGASLPVLGLLPVARLLGKPVLAKVAAIGQGVEAGDLRRGRGPLGALLAAWMGRCRGFVATTAEIEAALLAEGHPAARVVRIPNFVDTTLFHPPAAEQRAAARSALGVGERTVVLVSGRLVRRKNVDVLLEAFATATADSAGAGDRSPILLVLGDGPERASLEARAARPDLAGRVRFEGFQEDVTRWLFAADLLALPSSIEGFPNALLEALACGLPAVASDIGGAREALVEGASPPRAVAPRPVADGVLEAEGGLLVPVGDAGALARALALLLGDPARRRSLGDAAARRVAARFTLDAVAPRYVELYRRLADGDRLGPPGLEPGTRRL